MAAIEEYTREDAARSRCPTADTAVIACLERDSDLEIARAKSASRKSILWILAGSGLFYAFVVVVQYAVGDLDVGFAVRGFVILVLILPAILSGLLTIRVVKAIWHISFSLECLRRTWDAGLRHAVFLRSFARAKTSEADTHALARLLTDVGPRRGSSEQEAIGCVASVIRVFALLGHRAVLQRSVSGVSWLICGRESWREVVRALLRRASVIVMYWEKPSDGLSWEGDAIQSIGRTRDTLLITPFALPDEFPEEFPWPKVISMQADDWREELQRALRSKTDSTKT